MGSVRYVCVLHDLELGVCGAGLLIYQSLYSGTVDGSSIETLLFKSLLVLIEWCMKAKGQYVFGSAYGHVSRQYDTHTSSTDVVDNMESIPSTIYTATPKHHNNPAIKPNTQISKPHLSNHPSFIPTQQDV